jgi:hypothetical protein
MKISKSVIEKFVKYIVSLNNDASCTNNMESIIGTFRGSGDDHVILYADVDGYGNVTINANIKSVQTGREELVGKFKIPASIVATSTPEVIARMVADAIVDNSKVK